MPLSSVRIKRCKITIRSIYAVFANVERRGSKLPGCWAPLELAVESEHKLMRETVQYNQALDRRRSHRFPIEREVRYRVLGKRAGEPSGTGKTVNISSSGVLFSSTDVLLPGDHVELSISWPAQLDQKVPLRLVLRGPVVRLEQRRTAIEIQEYVFRTQAAEAGQRLVMA